MYIVWVDSDTRINHSILTNAGYDVTVFSEVLEAWEYIQIHVENIVCVITSSMKSGGRQERGLPSGFDLCDMVTNLYTNTLESRVVTPALAFITSSAKEEDAKKRGVAIFVKGTRTVLQEKVVVHLSQSYARRKEGSLNKPDSLSYALPQNSNANQTTLLYNNQNQNSAELHQHQVQVNKSKKLGTGGFGEVYEGVFNNHTVAIKCVHMVGNRAINEFMHEAKLMAKLKHDGIVTFYGYTQQPYQLVLEFCSEGSLFDYIQNDKPFSQATLLTWINQLASGLHYLHSQNIVHRDIKSPNVLLDSKLNAKWTDFGLSGTKHATATITMGTANDSAAKAMGSVQWMAPEQFDKTEKRTIKSDMYSFGVLIWELFSKKAPYKGIGTMPTIFMIVQGQKEDIPAHTPETFKCIIQSCWQQAPRSRPSAQQILDVLNHKISAQSLLPNMSSNFVPQAQFQQPYNQFNWQQPQVQHSQQAQFQPQYQYNTTNLQPTQHYQNQHNHMQQFNTTNWQPIVQRMPQYQHAPQMQQYQQVNTVCQSPYYSNPEQHKAPQFQANRAYNMQSVPQLQQGMPFFSNQIPAFSAQGNMQSQFHQK